MLEAVPNVSEGRDAAAIAEIGRAFGRDAALLDVHSDADHHRSVFTLAGESDALVESLVAGAAARNTAHRPRDARRSASTGRRRRRRAGRAARPGRDGAREGDRAAVAQRLGAELGLPVFLYGEVGSGRRPAFFRRGGLTELTRRVDAGELAPDAGPSAIDPRAGAVLVGARAPLVAYNVDLETDDLAIAVAVAAAVRESSGGMPGVQAIGLFLPGSGRVQVSMNVLDLDRAPLHEVVERVRAEAAARGVAIRGGELVGLVPERVLDAAERAGADDSRDRRVAGPRARARF